MKKYYLDNREVDLVNHSVMITGACRSGTSIMANIIHSCKDVELAFEPPMLRVIFSLIENIDKHDWKVLFNSFLFEEFLMQALDGRRLNFNKNDDSSIYNAKSSMEINNRIEKSNSRSGTFPYAIKKRIVFKTPEIMPWILNYQDFVPDSKAIVMIRNPVSQVNSLLRMGWFGDGRLNDVDSFWLHTSENPPYFPYWLEDEIKSQWPKMSELERTCYYYNLMYSKTESYENCIIVDYDSFVKDPFNKIDKIIKLIGVEKTEITNKLLLTVNEPKIDREVDFSSVPDCIVNKMFDSYKFAQALSI